MPRKRDKPPEAGSPTPLQHVEGTAASPEMQETLGRGCLMGFIGLLSTTRRLYICLSADTPTKIMCFNLSLLIS